MITDRRRNDGGKVSFPPLVSRSLARVARHPKGRREAEEARSALTSREWWRIRAQPLDGPHGISGSKTEGRGRIPEQIPRLLVNEASVAESITREGVYKQAARPAL